MKLLAILCAAALAGCTTTGAITTAALVDTDKAIIVADASYHFAEQLALAKVRAGASPATKATIDAANDKAATLLHTAYQARTSTAVALAVSAIADFTTLAGSK